jgi:hypothetical protein
MKAQFKSIGIVCSFVLFFSAYADSGSAECESDFWQLIQNSKFRSITSITTVKVKSDLSLLNEMEREAFDFYTADIKTPLNGERAFSVQLAQYNDRKKGTRVNGYRVKVDMSNAEKAKSFYYYTRDAELLVSYELDEDQGQPSSKTWHCENLSIQSEEVENKF